MNQGIDSLIGNRLDAYGSSPQALMERYKLTGETVDLLALQAAANTVNEAKNNMLANAETNMPNERQALEQEVFQGTRNQLLSQLGPGIQQQGQQMGQAALQQQQGGGPQPGPQPGPQMGLPGQRVDNMMMAAQGGIVGYAQGGSYKGRKYGQKNPQKFPGGETLEQERGRYQTLKRLEAKFRAEGNQEALQNVQRELENYEGSIAAQPPKPTPENIPQMAGGGIVSFQPGGFIERAGQRVMDYFDSGYQDPNGPSAFEQFLLDQGIDPDNVSAEQLGVLRDVFKASTGIVGEGVEVAGDFISERRDAADSGPRGNIVDPERNRMMVEGMTSLPTPNLENSNIVDPERNRMMVEGMTGEGEEPGFFSRAIDTVGEKAGDLMDYVVENPLEAAGYASLAIPGVGLAGLGARGVAAGARGIPAALRFLRGSQNVAPAGSRIGRGAQKLVTRPQTAGTGSQVRGPGGQMISAAQAEKLGIPLNRVISGNRAGATVGAGLLGADAVFGGDGETDEEIISDVVTTSPSSIEDTFSSANEQARRTQTTLDNAQREIATDPEQTSREGESGNVLERMVDEDMQQLRDTSPESSLFDKKLEQIMNRSRSPLRTIATFLQGYGEGKMKGAGKALRAAEAQYDKQEMELLTLKEANRISQEDFRMKREQIRNERRQLDIMEDRYVTQGKNEADRIKATQNYYDTLARGNASRSRIALQEAVDAYVTDSLRLNTDIAALERINLSDIDKFMNNNTQRYTAARQRAMQNYRNAVESGLFRSGASGAGQPIDAAQYFN